MRWLAPSTRERRGRERCAGRRVGLNEAIFRQVNEQIERVVEQAGGFEVVRKDEGEPAELSRKLDPRS